MRYLFVTEPGLESIASAEVCELWPSSRAVSDGVAMAGLVLVDSSQAIVVERLRTVQHVAVVYGRFEVGSCADLKAACGAIAIPELESALSFRVTAHLAGPQAFHAHEAAGAVGAALQQRYGTPVDLEGFAVEVRLDLYGDQAILSVQQTRSPLGRRIRRGAALRGAVKPTVAAAMLRLAGGHRGATRLLDPLCGAGTIPVEAKLTNHALEVCASDWDEPTVDVARATVANHGVDVDVRVGDARQLTTAWGGAQFTLIVTNPPFGQRLGRAVSLSRFYGELLRSFVAVLDQRGTIVVLSPRVKALQRARDGLPLELVSETSVESGGIRPRIHVLKPR